MRKDFTLDNQKVIATNATLLGYATNIIKRDSFFVYDDGGGRQLARSLGRLRATEEQGRGEIKTFVLALVLSGCARHCYIRWVDPADIVEAHDHAPTDLAAFFFAKEMPYDGSTMVALSDYGSLCQNYISGIHDRVRKWKTKEPQVIFD